MTPSDAPQQGVMLRSKRDFTVFQSRRLGGGSCSMVVLGELSGGDPVAVKIVDIASTQRGRGLARESADPMREVAILTRLAGDAHPNIVEILGFWKEGVTANIVTTLCDGGSLAKYLKAGLDTNSGEESRIVRRMVAELVVGMAYLEECGVVHRDLKPENVLLTAHNHVKIADFGSAILTSDIEGSGFAGSPDYASPEMLELSRTAGTPSDVWCFGCIVFEVHCGRPPFESQSEIELFDKIRSCSINPYIVYVPGDAQALVGSILVANPEARPSLQEIRASPYFSEVEWVNLHEYCNVSVLNANYTACLQRYLYLGEAVIYSGVVVKSRHLTSKKRILVATTLPRLFYIDQSTQVVKGTVPLAGGSYASALDDARFEVHTPKRVYHFSDPSNQAHTWAGKINDMSKM